MAEDVESAVEAEEAEPVTSDAAAAAEPAAETHAP